MEDGPSSSALPWLWVIEYLACFPQVKASLLHAVLDVAPELPDDLGKDMREVVALRCLEELCGPRIASADEGSREESGSKLDISMSCEEVLASVFHDDSVSDLKEAEQELLKWDMNSFLEHKRASLPLTSLQRLKIKINSSARSQDSSLNDIGGLASRNTEGQALGEYNKPGLEPIEKNRGDHHEEGVTGNLIHTSMEQRECDNARTSPRAKRSRTDPTTENLVDSPGVVQHGNGCPPVDHPNAKTSRPCLPSDLEASDPTIVPDSFDSPLRGSTNVAEDQIRTSEEGEILGGRAENFTLQSADSPIHRADNDDLLGKNDAISVEKEKINGSTDTAPNKEMESNQTECLPARHDAEKMSSGSDLHITIAERERKRQEFLNRVTEQNICKKCGEGVQLMACHSSTRPFVVHKNCVGLSATYNADGSFCCPTCYSSDIKTASLDSEKELSKARQNLDAFLKGPLGRQPERWRFVLEQHQSIHVSDEIFNECEHMFPKGRREARDHVVQDDNSSKKGTEGNGEKGEPSPHMCREKDNQDFSSREVSKERENSDADMTNDKNPELESENPEVDVVINQQDTSADDKADHADDLPHHMTNAMGISENANKESYHLRRRGRSKEVCITPIRRRTRQKKAEWTADEDMVLKEGVEKYTDKNGTSWTNILSFYGDRLKGRTTMDLKNRWNNTLRKAGK